MNARKVVIVVNPAAGGRTVDDRVLEVADRLRHARYDVSVSRSEGPGHVTTIARQTPDDTAALVVGGGDGTVREAAEGLRRRTIPIVVMPAGTENVLARHLGCTPRPADVAANVRTGRVITCDLGLVNGRSFLMMTGVGWDADVVRRLHQRRAGHVGRFSYVQPLWETFQAYAFPPIRVEVDGRCAFEGPGFAIVGNMPCYAMGLRILRDAIPDDGVLDVGVFPCASRSAFVGHAMRVLKNDPVGRMGVIYFRGKELRITSPDVVPIQCDGDPAGTLPAEISVDPRSVRFQVAKRVIGAD